MYRYINYMVMHVTDTNGIKTMLIQYLFAHSSPPPPTPIKSHLMLRETGDAVLFRIYRRLYYGLLRQCWTKCEGGKKTLIPPTLTLSLYI
jgi:hypothetical protein